MKKYLILLLMCFPIITYAQCAGTISGGGSSGSSTGSGTCSDNCCSGWYGNTCLWGWGFTRGLRFQIYVVNNRNSATLLGKGVDVWARAPEGGIFTKPNTNDLQRKFNCYNEWPDLESARQDRSNISVSYADYLSGNYGTVVVRGGVVSSGNVNDWAFTYKDNQPKSGFLKAELFDKLIAKDYDYVKSVWNMTDSDITKLNEAIIAGNAYVTAEVIYQYVDADTLALFHGTVSENAYVHSCTTPEVWLYTATTDPNSGTLVTNNSSTTMIHKVSAYNGEEQYGNNGYTDATHATYSACRYAYGWTSWNIKEVCDTCAGCESECGYSKKGTAGRAACAVAFCNKKEPKNKANCIKTCTSVPDDKPCDSKTNPTCEDYKGDKSKTTLSCKPFSVAEREGLSQTVKKTVCYDSSSYKGDVTESQYKVDTLKYGVNYYRINCDDVMNFKNLPSKQEIFLSTISTSNIHFSYRLDREVKCSIEYRASDEYIKDHKVYFIKMDKDPDKDITDAAKRKEYKANYRIFQDIDNVKKAKEGAVKRKEEINKGSYSADLKKELLEIQDKTIEYLDAMLADLNKTIKISKDRLQSITSKKNNPDEIELNVLNVKIVDSSDTSTDEVEIPLKPISCTEVEVTDKCLFNGLTGEGKIAKEITCDNTEGEQETYAGGTVSTFTETIIYSIDDSSYVAAQADEEGTIYYSETDCAQGVKAYNGMCKEIEFGYALPPYDGPNIRDYVAKVNSIPGKVQLKVNGGLCDEINFDYNCDYTLTYEYCTKCKGKKGDDYADCVKKNCSCDAYCGSDQVCRTKFCPEPCPLCGADVITCDTCHEKCKDYSSNKSSKEYLTCYYDECCTKKCDGDCACTLTCCREKCAIMYKDNAAELTKCRTECDKKVPCPDTPKNPNYIFRSIDQDNPFPDREKNVGNNWYNKIDFIKKANTPGTDYYEDTNGMNDRYEYSVKINSKQLKEIKKKVNTYYKSFGKSKNYFSERSDEAYCSKFLYEELNTMGVQVTVDSKGSYNCKKG